LSINVITPQDVFEWIKEKDKLWRNLEELQVAHRELMELINFGRYKNQQFKDVFDEKARPLFFMLLDEVLCKSANIEKLIASRLEPITQQAQFLPPQLQEELKKEGEKEEGAKEKFKMFFENVKNLFTNIMEKEEEEYPILEPNPKTLLDKYNSALNWIAIQGEKRRQRELLEFQSMAVTIISRIVSRTMHYTLEQLQRINQLIPFITPK